MKQLLLTTTFLALMTVGLMAQTVTSISPFLNADDVSSTSNITINFSEGMDNSTINSSTVIVSGSQRGIYSGSFSYGTNSATFDPADSFFAGEIITVVVTEGVENASNTPITSPYRTMFTAAASGSGEFSSSDVYTVDGSNFADWSITADINEDGYVDIITLVPSQNKMSIFTNDGDGSFSGPTNYTTANSFQVEAKDVNQDGAVDLVTSNNNAFMMSVFMNNGSGSGTFAAKVDYANGSSWNGKALTTGDIDNDGDEDVLIDIIIGGSVDSVQVFTNDGDGTFTVADGISTTSGFEQLKLVDIDDDQDLDLVGISPGLGQLVTYDNDGTGTFSLNTTHTATSSSYQFTLANFVSSSATIEAITADQANDQIRYFGDGTIHAFGATPVTTLIGDTPVAIASGDLDGDGHIDVVVSNSTDQNLSILTNDGSANFTESNYSTTGTYANYISLTDVDNDGDLDIIMANQNGTLAVVDNFAGTQVTSITPANGSTEIASNANITVEFNDAMKVSTLNSTNVTVVGNAAGSISATYTYNSGDSTLTIDPSSDFILGDDITVTVTTNVTNEGDQAIALSSASTFTVEGVNVQSIIPSQNAVGIAANSDIDITFNDTMDGATLTSSNILVFGSLSGQVSGSISTGSNTATFNPTSDFIAGELVSVIVTTGVENSSNVALEAPNVFQFTVDGSVAYVATEDTVKSTGAAPTDVAILDVNLDGDLDLVITNGTDNTVSIFQNDGSGGYTTASTLSTGTYPTSISTGDFDNANGMDFVVTNYSENDIRVFTNNGSGTFTTADYSAGSGAADAVVADFDGDGYLDIAIHNRNASNASILLNDGDGTFTSSGTVSATSNMDRIFAADIDGDKDIDIAMGGAGTVLFTAKNNGDGTFATAINTGFASYDAEFVDLDGDDILDLVVSDDGSNEVSVHLNDGSGSFGSATNYTVADAREISIVDYNGDGDMDIVAVSYNGSFAQVLENGGSGTFTTGQTFDVGTVAVRQSVADLDEDGQLDFVTVNRTANTLSINYGTEFVEVTSVSPSANSVSVSATENITATFNSDMNSDSLNSSTVLVYGSNSGLLPGVVTYDSPSKTMTFNPDNSFKAGEEVIVTITTGAENTNGSSLTNSETFSFIAEASGAGYFTYAVESSVFPNNVGTLYGADLDGDGDQDMVGINYNYFSVRFNDGSGSYGFGTATDYYKQNAGSIRPADLDNDGDIDLMVMRGNDKYLVFMENNGSGVFTPKDSISTNGVVTGGRWDIGDFNQDGNIDVAISDYTGSAYAIYIYTNDGNMDFTSYYQSADISDNSYLDISDLNNDGHLDFVLGDRYETFAVILNNGDGTLGSETTFSAPSGSTSRGIAADLNGDGYKDLIFSHFYATDGNSFSIYLNDGDGTFGSPTSTSLSFDGFWVDAADMDGDNDLDIVIGKNNTLSIAYNDGSGTIEESINYSITGSNSGPAIFDYDGDNDLDIINPAFSNLSYLSNTTPGTPSSAVTSLSFSNVVADQLTASWSNGNGTGRLLVAKQGSAVDATPTDDTFYTADDFGAGSELGTGNYVVYAGTGSSATIAGLTPDSTYHFALYEYNKGSTVIKYLTSGPATGSVSTQLYPSSASTVSIDDDQGTVLELSWSGGDGAKQLVAIREGSAITWEPSDSTTYSANASFTSAADLGDGTKVISNDNTGAVTVTDLSLSTTYYITVFDYNGDAGFETYLTSSTGTASKTTQSFEGVAFDSTAGYAYHFDGGNILDSYGELYTNSTVIIDDAFTTEIWIKPDTTGIQQYFLSWYEEQLVLGINSSNQLFGFHTQQGTGGSQVTVTGTTTITKGEWYHVALTGKTGGNLTLYVNGVEEASSAITDVSGDDDYDDYWYLGSEYAESNYFYGAVDELRIWSAVRTESQIRSFMHRPYVGLTTDLGGYWQFNEGTGDGVDGLNSYDVDFSDETGWVQSSAPLGGRTMNLVSSVQSGTLNLGNVTINLTENFDNAVDIYAFESSSTGSAFANEAFYPSGYTSLFGDSRFIIKVFGDPGTFSANLTLGFGSGTIPSGYDSTPDSLTLYTRSTNSEGSWTEVGGASAVSSTAGTATWNGLTSFSQFAAVDTGNIAAPTVTFAKANYADASLEANQDRIAYDVWITRGDDQGLYNAYSESSFSSSTSPDGTLWSFGTSADVESLTFENWKSAVSSDPPSSVGKEMVMYLPEHDEYIDIKFMSWTSNGNGGGFSYTRTVVDIPYPSPITFDSTAGYALEFDGTDDYMKYSTYIESIDEYEDMPSPVTFEMWVNVDSLTDGKMVLMASYGTTFQIGIDSTDHFYGKFRNTSLGNHRATGTTTVVEDQWYHLAISVESNDFVKLYVNGTIEDSTSMTDMNTGLDGYYFGASRYLESGGYHYLDGKMDEVRIWQEARSDSAIRAGMFSSNLNATKLDILSYWQMNEGSGNTVDDKANNQDLVLDQNGATYQPAWVTSNVPIGGSTSEITNNFQSGSVTVGNASLNMADDFDNPVDIQVSEVTNEPNQYPSGFSAGVGGKYFVINLYGDPGTFSTSLSLDYGAGVITASQESNPSLLKLYKRSSTSTGAWTEVASASTAVESTGVVTWSGITSFSQFIAVADEPVYGINISDGSDVVSYNDSTFEFTSNFFAMGSFADSELTINSKSTLSGDLFLDQNDNGVYDDGTDNLLTAGSEFSYTPSGSVKLRYRSANSGVETATIKLQLNSDADSVSLDFFTVEGDPSIAGNTGESGWYLLSNPMDSTVGMLLSTIWTQGAVNSNAPSGDATLYRFIQDSAQYVAITTDLDTTILSAGEGLLAYIFEDDDLGDGQSDIDGGWPKTLTNYGIPFGQSSDITIKNVDYDGVSGTTGSEGFALLGNPFGWTLSADSVIATLKREDALANSYVYRWDPVNKTYKIISSGSIEAYESVFVRVIGSGITADLNFDYNDAIVGPSKKAQEENLEFNLTHAESGLVTTSSVRFDEKGDTGIDPYDGYYLGSYASKFANLFSLINDQALTINNLPKGLGEVVEIPLYLDATISGEFQLNWDSNQIPEGWTFELEEVTSGAVVNLSEQESLSFNAGTQRKQIAASIPAPLYTFEKISGRSKTAVSPKPVFILKVISNTAVSNENDLGIPMEVELYQNYPNPFNPTSVIRYGVPDASKVRLEVFDILGRNVMTLVNNEAKSPGRYNVQFDARSLASGLYIYRLVVGDKVMTKKMTLIK